MINRRQLLYLADISAINFLSINGVCGYCDEIKN
jgi:hypothetical protein